MLTWIIFENFYAVMALLVLFEKFEVNFFYIFFTLMLSASPSIVHFVCTFSIMRA